ncbi:spermidine synthase [Synechococcus sp. PCC 6312]|uniref:spermidine synthase n=1 Tax=Synechococcus sp. (strain ATCC 27167 / PCC 6312) TaxID=195253 RepID=UPI00029EDB7B|nr:fused MFS/spermidine synthase [Synechococcus sp. PCC 6312]AFY59625.1 hypothetical protein Syn6312_0394 [Synechococcus sp. PCC 6312]
MVKFLLPIYALSLGLSAMLLFWVQLMVAKMLLPLLGGAPAVWNTCLFFFQALLLLGYGYSDWSTQRFCLKNQVWLQGLVLLIPLGVLPLKIAVDWLPPVDANPIPWVLAVLLLGVGVPFFALSTLAPLLQAWFSSTSHPQAQDPYFLYGASNFGSLMGLLGYPLVLEPHLTLTQQNQLWAGLYGCLVLLVGVCGGGAMSSQLGEERTDRDDPQETETSQGSYLLAVSGQALTSLRMGKALQLQLRWVMLAFIPASWLLSVTTYITTDIAAIPLFWAIPLSLYLVTFIVSFARPQATLPKLITGAFPLAGVVLVMLLLLKVTQPLGLVLSLHLIVFTIAASLFHQKLAQSRPDPAYLTRFYLAIALGGMLGGLVNSLIAPLVFTTVLEYPWIIVVSLLLLPDLELGTVLRLTWPLGMGLLLGCLLIGLNVQIAQQSAWGFLMAFGLLIGLAWIWGLKKWRIGLGLVLVGLLGQFSLSSLGGVLATERSFFGVYQVLADPDTGVHSLIHGTTVHGRQNMTPGQTQVPLTYFTPTGPIGQVFTALGDRLNNVAILGLGVGTLMSYAQPGQAWSFYEIDPLVVSLAQTPQYFTYLTSAMTKPQITLGDGRLSLAQAPDHSLDLLVMDAFSSDAIPIHLITQEALELYFTKLTPTGLVAINITNRFLDLEPVIAALSKRLNLFSVIQWDQEISQGELQAGKTPSRWVLLTKDTENLADLRADPRWEKLTGNLQISAWTDDFSQLLPLIRPLR